MAAIRSCERKAYQGDSGMGDSTESNVLISSIKPTNLLSFGPDFEGLELRPLNVLIGPNGSGKSNLIEAIAFMRATRGDCEEMLRRSGGAGDWIWKGGDGEDRSAKMEWTIHHLTHLLEFEVNYWNFSISSEIISAEDGILANRNRRRILLRDLDGEEFAFDPDLKPASLSIDRSLVAGPRPQGNFPDLAYLSVIYDFVRIYREWSFGRESVLRAPQRADVRNNYLLEDFSNLGMVLSRLAKVPLVKRKIVENLSKLYQGVTGYDVVVEGGTVQVFFTEGDFSIPATRLSDGTIRYLCLLTILCDPAFSEGLICIEEPELGLHPDILPTVAELLKEASQRVQLIVTTHSDIIIDALSDMPEAVVVCEKHEGRTKMKRLVAGEMEELLKNYRLGQLWISGDIGGTRW